MDQTAVEFLAEKLLENQTYDRDGYVIIDISVEHFQYLVERAKQIDHHDKSKQRQAQGIRTGADED